MPDSRPIGLRLFSFFLAAYSIYIGAWMVWAVLVGNEISPLAILNLVLIVAGLLAAISISRVEARSKWLFLWWLVTLGAIFLIGMTTELGDEFGYFELLVGASILTALGYFGFRYLERVCRPAV